MLSETPATMAICLGPEEVLILSTISGGNSECISMGLLSSCIFQRILRFLTLSLFRIFSSFCQAVRWGLPPSVGQSAPWANAQPSAIATTKRVVRMRAPVFLETIHFYTKYRFVSRILFRLPLPRQPLRLGDLLRLQVRGHRIA